MTGSDLGNDLAIFPMVEEDAAVGRVAGVYARLLERMPLVPSLFKSLAVCPPYLVLAAEQTEGVLDAPDFATVSTELLDSVRGASTPTADPAVRHTLAAFTGPLCRMLLLSAGLLRALAGDLDAPSAPGRMSAAAAARPADPAPSQWDATASVLYGEIRSALDTPLVNSIWRSLQGAGQLESAWRALGPQAPGTRTAARRLQQRAIEDVKRVRWPVAADRPALEAIGIAD
ncbi:MAG TPA: hypothetical protein VFJ14_06120, partial [Nocardioidaceae bacterium]|nr:hypothetical protein [Nocardioidaceae bacterium]